MDNISQIETSGSSCPTGSLNYSGGYGKALYSIKVIGSKNTARL